MIRSHLRFTSHNVNTITTAATITTIISGGHTRNGITANINNGNEEMNDNEQTSNELFYHSMRHSVQYQTASP